MVEKTGHWENLGGTEFASAFLGADEYKRARERGRLMAASAVATRPDVKAAMEARFGVERCRQLWPEAYQKRRSS